MELVLEHKFFRGHIGKLADGSKPYFFMSHAQASGGAQTRVCLEAKGISKVYLTCNSLLSLSSLFVSPSLLRSLSPSLLPSTPSFPPSLFVSRCAIRQLLTRLLENACPAVLLDKIWLDVDKDPTAEEMRKGIEDAQYVIIFLTKGSLRRYFCQLEVRYALKVKNAKNIILINDEPSSDPGFGGHSRLLEMGARGGHRGWWWGGGTRGRDE